MVSSAMPMAVDTCVGEVQLFIRCEKLKDLDTFSKSDPQVLVKIQTAGIDAQFKEAGRTETI
jgi:hypothetical protein